MLVQVYQYGPEKTFTQLRSSWNTGSNLATTLQGLTQRDGTILVDVLTFVGGRRSLLDAFCGNTLAQKQFVAGNGKFLSLGVRRMAFSAKRKAELHLKTAAGGLIGMFTHGSGYLAGLDDFVEVTSKKFTLFTIRSTTDKKSGLNLGATSSGWNIGDRASTILQAGVEIEELS